MSVAAMGLRVACIAAAVAASAAAFAAGERRIVSLGGAVTEILYALGLEDEIVAVDTTSLYPPRALQEKPNVGYLRQLSPEGIIGKAPTMILSVEGAGPKETISVLAAASIRMVTVPESFDADGILARIKAVGEATGATRRSECLASLVQDDLDALGRIRARIDRPVRVMFVLSFASGRPMVAGRNTAADGIIRLAGAVNAVGEFDGYKAVGDEAVIVAAPDVVLAMQRQGMKLSAREVFASPAFAPTPAASDQRFITMEGAYLLSFGPRTARAARDLAARLYPALAPPALPSEGAGQFDKCRART